MKCRGCADAFLGFFARIGGTSFLGGADGKLHSPIASSCIHHSCACTVTYATLFTRLNDILFNARVFRDTRTMVGGRLFRHRQTNSAVNRIHKTQKCGFSPVRPCTVFRSPHGDTPGHQVSVQVERRQKCTCAYAHKSCLLVTNASDLSGQI